MQKLAAFFIPGILLLATGCSTASSKTADKKQVVTKTAGLQQQNLEEGECAVFLWAAGGKREFVYFQKQDSATAQLYRNDQTIAITTTDNTSQLADAGSLNLSYVGGNGEKIEVTGGYGGELEGGIKIAPATINFQIQDGWEQITPASGVFACL